MIKIFVVSTGRTGTKSIARKFGLTHEWGGLNVKPSFLVKHLRKLEDKGIKMWGDSGAYWKYCLDDLMERIPDAFYIHLIRNGRDVVNSFWHHYRRIYYSNKKVAKPHHDYSIPISGFDKLSRFEKLCWHWRYWNEFIEERVPTRIRLEDIQHLLPVTNKGVSRKEWSNEEEKQFQDICGETMRRYGYE